VKPRYEGVVCRLKEIRRARGMSQGRLAELVGVKRQAIYDIESGKYVPNTVLALRLAHRLGCGVEDLFFEESADEERAVTLAERQGRPGGRVIVAKVRGRLVGYPLSGRDAFNEGFKAADGLLEGEGGAVRLLRPESALERTVLLLGCDPAFSILGSHVSRRSPEARLHCRFASSRRALQGLAAGHAHLAGTHLHNTDASEEANVGLARQCMGSSPAWVVAFSFMEEGLMVARGNPLGIRTVADLAGEGVRMVNREEGAALRALLDDRLERAGVPAEAVRGYFEEVSTHLQGARSVACGFADAALGLRAVAEACGLGFVPLETARCDLVVPEDLKDHPAVKIMLDTLQTRSLREELVSLPGYEASRTGDVVARLR